MPELPEVETIVRGLKRKVVGRKITGLWTDWPKYFKTHKSEADFRKHVVGKRIEAVTRRAKNILFHLSDDHLLLIHQKLSGHVMVGRWEKNIEKNSLSIPEEKWRHVHWLPNPFKRPLTEPMNRFIRLLFFLDNGDMIALSDIRRFAKVLCGPKEMIFNLPDLKDLGIEPLDPRFTAASLGRLLKNKRGPIKQILLDQTLVAGIGNIYADEILWATKLHPLTRVEKLSEKKIKELYFVIRDILKKAIKLHGSSVGDYRDTEGREGGYEKFHNAYQKTGKPCPRCKTLIKRIKIGVRSAHFCPKCQHIG